MQLTAIVTPSVPCGGYLENSASSVISFTCQPSGSLGVIHNLDLKIEGLTVRGTVVLDSSVVCESEQLYLVVIVNSDDETWSSNRLNVVGSCTNTEASLYTCTISIAVSGYNRMFSVNAEVKVGNEVVGTMPSRRRFVSGDYCSFNLFVCAGLPILIILIVTAIICVILILFLVKKKLKKSDKEEAHELKDQTDDCNVDHEKGPAGDEYAVVDKKPRDTVELTSQGVYQDPNTIEHKEGPETGDLYAVTEKKPKKKSKKAEEKPDEDIAAMYSVPDKKKKAQQQGITYADVDIAAPRSGDKPLQQPLQTEYATVVN